MKQILEKIITRFLGTEKPQVKQEVRYDAWLCYNVHCHNGQQEADDCDRRYAAMLLTQQTFKALSREAKK